MEGLLLKLLPNGLLLTFQQINSLLGHFILFLFQESVDNQDLRDKLLATEQRLYEVQQRRQNKETQSIAV